MVRDQVLLVDVIECNGQQVPPSQQSSPAISTLNNPIHLHIPGHQGHGPTVTVRDSYGTRSGNSPILPYKAKGNSNLDREYNVRRWNTLSVIS